MKKFNVIKPITGSFFAFAYFGLFVMSVLFYILIPDFIFLVLLLGTCASFLYFSYKLLFQKVTISSQGVKYKTPFTSYELIWKDIKAVGVADFSFLASRASWIYFSEQDKRIDNISGMKTAPAFIMMNYREPVISEIKKYWHGEIYY
ncbi:hypothetical protein DP73_18000 [Desulfosporosinus sp. HMP52]|uniref:hypothetical protein n=1 Tax=Desulfosporosinus sp. HMP52 TaxID=1487923 RepID=UPI00051FD5E7|nr:hypothetical protein [Desulfosporosinus sp. HMP52]KGK85827.1 hypothetical protein DP73_18000 [Desulfosporosinus sp. HMP52]